MDKEPSLHPTYVEQLREELASISANLQSELSLLTALLNEVQPKARILSESEKNEWFQKAYDALESFEEQLLTLPYVSKLEALHEVLGDLSVRSELNHRLLRKVLKKL